MSWTSEELEAAVALLQKRQPALVAHYGLAEAAMETIAEDALNACDGDDEGLPLVIDVFAWRWAENEAALHFDFSADGGNYKMAALADQATKRRIKAEDEAYRQGVLQLPAAELTAVGGVWVCA